MKRTVQYSRYYYKSVSKEVDIPDDVPLDEQEVWAFENVDFEKELAEASLNTEEDTAYILED